MTVEELLKKYALGARDFSALDLSEANLIGVKLTDINLSHSNLSLINFSGANLISSNLSYAKLNVARLRGAYLSNANLNNASLNVANLIRADLSSAQLQKATLIRAELIRANLSNANLWKANLSGSDLREATLRQVNFNRANLHQVTLKDASLTGANLEQANLNNSDLARSNMSGSNFRDAQLKQANLSRSNLSGANLSGANLRWADLSGANLRWADLSGAKLSGAKLVGADLSNSNLTNVSLVQADLTNSKLIKTEWVGADLTGATLTGSRLYGTSRFGLKTNDIICEWVDLSPNGDRSVIHKFNPEESKCFFNKTSPTVKIIVDKALDYEAHLVLAGAYYQIARYFRHFTDGAEKHLEEPPSIEIGSRRTVITFRINRDEFLLAAAYIAIIPFKDAEYTQKSICMAVDAITSEDVAYFCFSNPTIVQKLKTLIEQVVLDISSLKKMKNSLQHSGKKKFFQASTQIIMTNSSAQTLMIYENPNFGTKIVNNSEANTYPYKDDSNNIPKMTTLSQSMIIDFINGFYEIVV
ncbi:pentapeptide repeat-containing protein [Mastigocoleus sp. MO_188.B34]|uniref:pentapeptide repeat-containing protein n=1 Tax=Mastigocoleus sp. MO_188.B34 TaxID=3036635 RepID=UPI00261288D2|nr:pentapeptide repeat-containing protein [Mastigocoleus sp. MO_188.B34]MDJ0694465.1 pentapeptide repeat-containing protein [Mastigocoleus sp. MO_188.B34]